MDTESFPPTTPRPSAPEGPARVDRPFGSWLLGNSDDDDHRLRIRVRWLLAGSLFVANLVGMAVAMVLAIWVIPGPDVFQDKFAAINFIAVPVYVALAWTGITGLGIVTGLRVLRWAVRSAEGQELDERQRRATLRLPADLTVIQAVGWLGGLIVFTLLYGLVDVELIPKLVFSILLSGTVTCANAYLLSEFALRPIAARALSAGPPLRRSAVGVTIRTLLFWGIGSAAPVLGGMAVAISAIYEGDDVSRRQLIITVLALGAVMLSAGFLLTLLTARATMAPIMTVRAAQARVERGELDAEVIVFDGTELGRLQAGFNDMVAGLRERERVKDLFGKHVGQDVAQVAMTSSLELGGELHDVAVLFVDVVGSTRIAATKPPTEVVEVLNRFFAVVVDEINANGGFVNKFQGDAALAIFGAPTVLPDANGHALTAARRMIARLEREVPEFSAGIGVSAGQAVAGYVGAESRLEYTVIGDPVNEAARLTELAKTVPGHVAVSQRAVDGAWDDEKVFWRQYRKVKLRGRTERTMVAVLAAGH
ncbi:MAG: adenylate/guanylate cyclase domain-containing protein [Thermocrispum sp.]